MSPWPRKRARLALYRDRIGLIRLSSGRRPIVEDSVVVRADTVEPSQVPFEALSKILARPEWRCSRLEVVLSHHLCRFALLPAGFLPRNTAEENTFARLRIAQENGGLPDDWAVTLEQGDPSRPRVACAIDGQLVEALDSAAGSADCKVTSIQPLMAATYNSRRPTLDRRHVWFVTAEPGRCCIGRLRNGRWESIRLRRLFQDAIPELCHLLQQERLAADTNDLPDDTAICLSGLHFGSDDSLPGWTFLPHPFATGLDADVAVAMEGL